MTFAERLKELRTEKNMSMDDVGKEIGVTRVTIHRYEKGIITNVPPENVHKLANLFGVTRPYLMGWTDERGLNPGFNLDMVAGKLKQEVENRAASSWKPLNSKDCITAATQALRALNKYKISKTPIYSQQIIQESSLATMIAFGDEVQNETFKSQPLAIITEHKRKPDAYTYLFQVAKDAPIGRLNLTLAVELGHIYLGHSHKMLDKESERSGQCFAIHLLFPRPVIRLLQERGFVFTERTFSMIFGYCDWCLNGIINAEPVAVSAELNRLVKEQFAPYIDTLEEYGLLHKNIYNNEELLDLSNYMAGYED